MRRIPVKVVVVTLSILAAACANTASTTQMAEQNAALVKRSIDEVWAKKNFAAIPELYAADVVSYSHGIRDTTTLEQRVKGLEVDYPGFTVTVDEVFATTDRAVMRWTFKGTYKATGKSVSVPGMTISRITNGKIVEDYADWDGLAPTLALGYTLTPPAAPAAEPKK